MRLLSLALLLSLIPRRRRSRPAARNRRDPDRRGRHHRHLHHRDQRGLVLRAGTTYNQVTSLKLPVVVSCANATSAGCLALGGDPISGTAKSLYAVQQATAYTVTVTNSTGTLTNIITVPALPAPAPTVSKQWSCTGTILYSLMSDGTFQTTGTGLACTETK